MKLCRRTVAVSFVLLVASPAFAQEAAGAPEPTEEHEVLEMFVGTWNGEGELKSGPFGPGGPMSWTEECSWFGDAGFHVVCRSQGEGPMGPMQGLGIIGYDPAKEVYTHYGIDSTGWAGMSEGTRDGDTWIYESRDTMGDATFHSRMSMTMESPTRMTFTWSMSEDGESWTEMMAGTSEKQ